MIIAVCDPKGIAIEAIKTILYHDKGLSDRISRIYEFWNMEQLLDASRDSSFDCIVFPNYCNSHNSVVCSLSCGYNRFPLVEHDPRYTLIVRDILYWETARSLWTQYLKAIPGKEEKVKRAIRGILADYEKEERDIIYLESKNHCVLVHLDGIRQTPEGSPSFYATLDEAEHEFASSAFLRIHKSYLINGDHAIVLKIVEEVFEQIRDTPYSQVAENRIRQESNLQKTKRAAAEKKIKAAQHALERFEGEILKCLDGTSNFTEDMIAKQIRRYQQELDDAKAKYAELQNARLNEAAEIRKLRTYYDDFKGWAEEFDTAPLEMKRMILSHLIDRVEVGRKYQVIVKFNMKYRQFLECTAETYNTEIGA